MHDLLCIKLKVKAISLQILKHELSDFCHHYLFVRVEMLVFKLVLVNGFYSCALEVDLVLVRSMVTF